MFHTQITSVSVYRRGCVIHRRGTVRLSEGSQSIRLLGPGRGIDPDSLRLSVPEGVEGANVQLGYLTPMEQEEMLKELQMSLQKLSRQIESAREQRELWKQNADFTARDHISLTEMTGYLEQLPQRLEALEERLDQLEKEQDSLNKALAEQQRKAQLPYISAELKTTVPGEYPIEVRYKDNHAAWAPLYELHASEEEQGSLLLRLRSRISQSTGEDWNRVRLHLFSGNPALSGTIPQLQPRLLQFYEPPRMSAKAARARPMMDVAAAGMVMEESVEVDRTEELPSLRMSQVNADSGQTIQGDTMTEYELSGQWDIRDGQNILCDLRSDEIPCRYQVVAVPRVSEEAYLSAEVKTADLEEMQWVEASVYLKGTFAGQVVLQPDMTEETYQLS
ncbi:MAG: mucoidy inhibitor MuiA family protein, partial [Lachnospiraceae bacterium]|nr:mucoidy inhibitor MuiA family protein [Lachnospiraceae bacterium]